jgi:hypothetical protein
MFKENIWFYIKKKKRINNVLDLMFIVTTLNTIWIIKLTQLFEESWSDQQECKKIKVYIESQTSSPKQKPAISGMFDYKKTSYMYDVFIFLHGKG